MLKLRRKKKGNEESQERSQATEEGEEIEATMPLVKVTQKV